MKRRKVRPLPSPPPKRATAIALQMPTDDLWSKILLALLALLVLLSLVSCDFMSDQGPQKADYGPEVSTAEVSHAISNTWRDSDPTTSKVGAFVHFETTDAIAGTTIFLRSADTGQTVLRRHEDGPYITFDLYEKKIYYSQGQSKPEQMSREFELVFEKPTVAALNQKMIREVATWANSMSQRIRSATIATSTPSPTPAPTPSTSEPPEQQLRVTFHRLQTSEYVAGAPAAVAKKANCLGIPNCQLRYRAVSFDVVFWDTTEGNRTRVEFISSPDAPQIIGYNMTPFQPFYPGLMKSCLTQMVDIGESNAKTLVTECQNVVDFDFEAPPTP